MELVVLWTVLVAASVGAQEVPVNAQEFAFECPPDETTGKFPDPYQCDLYWECFRGEAKLMKCADGLAFDPERVRTQREPCDYLFNVNCTGREELQEPKPTEHCPRANGLFPHETDCGKYYSCKDSVAQERLCSPGLHFSLKTKTCDWEAAAGRGSCDTLQSIGDFTCDPSVDYFTPDNQKIVHPTFPNLEDCALFYVCKNGVVPAISKCNYGLVYNTVTAGCDDPVNVPECATYYDTVEETPVAEAV
ncbi:Protein obstructor-E [Amphibalanus amphitrite]|uniref:Protein obstructor-E n=1 Tax=Amphibalanus amphitrite TaxID=1232801 RepID=A0A6A4WCT3_AMPAM|nr:peritrophin-1-like [Amphibalanus amphitrite]KAF0299848.1 Protein obstructor-E [Amphibalanus amphitrite]